MSDREPLPEPKREGQDYFPEEEDGQFSLLDPYDDGLSLGEWMETLPPGDQYRTWSRALGWLW